MKASEGIKTFVERRVDDVWQRVPNEAAPPNLPLDPSWNLYYNFELFGLLAGVNVKHFEAYIPPRGLPWDTSDEVKALWQEMRETSHTPQYWMLSELIDCGSKSKSITAHVDMANYKLFKKGEAPKRWDDARGSYVVVDNKYMERIIKLANLVEEHVSYYTEITFDYPYKLVSKRLWEELVPAMQKLDNAPDNIRMIFWFDR